MIYAETYCAVSKVLGQFKTVMAIAARYLIIGIALFDNTNITNDYLHWH
mgnify:CR=1|tara:strand:+ start:3278 stop:3424 length:147 start_codon:yes stop_codon:yes gene_type:complete